MVVTMCKRGVRTDKQKGMVPAMSDLFLLIVAVTIITAMILAWMWNNAPRD